MGQLSPGSTVQFRRISWSDSLCLLISHKKWLGNVDEMISLRNYAISSPSLDFKMEDSPQSPVLYRHPPSNSKTNSGDLQMTFRQVIRFSSSNLYSDDIEISL